MFGVSWLADAYVIAFRIPNLLRDLFAEGALSSAFVPTFTDALAKGGRLVTCGATSGPIGETDIRVVFWKQVSIIGSTLSSNAAAAAKQPLFVVVDRGRHQGRQVSGSGRSTSPGRRSSGHRTSRRQ